MASMGRLEAAPVMDSFVQHETGAGGDGVLLHACKDNCFVLTFAVFSVVLKRWFWFWLTHPPAACMRASVCAGQQP